MRRALVIAVASAALATGGCVDTAPSGPGRGSVAAPISLALAGAPTVRAVAVEISATDIVPTLVVHLTVDTTARTASGTVSIPAGSARTITVRAYDAAGIETHRGSVTTDVTEGTAPTLAITVMPFDAGAPIVGVVGRVIITLLGGPPAAGLYPGDTLRLSAQVRDSARHVLAVPVAWASTDPGVAVVDAAGLVTAVDSGDAFIAASLAGTAAVVGVHVR